jgi:hypothetical protein
MSSAKTQNAVVSIGFGGLLTLLLIAAKLWGQIDWSWWWVCSPLWAPTAAFIVGMAGALVVAGLFLCIGHVIESIGRAIKGRRDNNL